MLSIVNVREAETYAMLLAEPCLVGAVVHRRKRACLIDSIELATVRGLRLTAFATFDLTGRKKSGGAPVGFRHGSDTFRKWGQRRQ